MKPAPPVSGTIYQALAKRFAPPSWALLEQVADGTGWTGSRYADAIAMSLWPSRGIDVHGIEVKASRSDWLRELKAPHKAEPIAGYCDFWWLAVAPGVIDLAVDAFPQPWGILVLRGRQLAAVRQAERNPRTEPLDKVFVAAVLRRASEANVPRSSIAESIEAAREEAFKRGAARHEGNGAERALAELRKSVRAFEGAAGIELGHYFGEPQGRRFAAAVALDTAKGHWAFDNARRALQQALDSVNAAAEAVKAAAEPQAAPEGS